MAIDLTVNIDGAFIVCCGICTLVGYLYGRLKEIIVVKAATTALKNTFKNTGFPMMGGVSNPTMPETPNIKPPMYVG